MATTLGVAASGTSLLNWFGKVNRSTPPPTKIDARLTSPKLLSAHKPLGAYLSDTSQSASG
jgi:hypothetical protein